MTERMRGIFIRGKDFLNRIFPLFIYYKKNHGEISFILRKNTSDNHIFEEVYLKNSYDISGFEIGQSDVVVDIGAHIGLFTILASRKASKGNIYAFEPAASNFRILLKNIALNHGKNIEAFRWAIGDRDGFLTLYTSRINPALNSIVKSQRLSETENVLSKSLDTLFAELDIKKCDFLKVDCEGSEFAILETASVSTIGKIERIVGEFHLDSPDSKAMEKLKYFLESNGLATTFFHFSNLPTTGMFFAKR